MNSNEWIRIEGGLPYGPVHDKNYKRVDSFTARHLNVPGTVIRVSGGQGEYLIGDINPLAGVCDDCTEFTPDKIVLAYKVIWKRGD